MTDVVLSEEDAWRLLETAWRDENSRFELDFQGWPDLRLTLRGNRFDASLTTSVMQGVIDLEHRLRAAYALLCYGHTHIGKLSRAEKDALKVVARIAQRSSHEDLDITAIAKLIAKKLIEKMDSRHLTLIVISAMLLYAGSTCFNAWLDKQAEERKLDLEKFSSDQDVKRMEIMHAVIDKTLSLSILERDADESRNAFLKSLSEADEVQIAGHALSKETVGKLTNSGRESSIEIFLKGMFRVDLVNTKAVDGYKITVRSIDEDGLTLSAEVKPAELLAAEFGLLKDAAFAKEPVRLHISARQVRGEIRSAKVLNVSRPEANP